MASVENRILGLKFDNRDFEKNAAVSMKTIDQLEKKLDPKSLSKGVESVGKNVEKSFSGLYQLRDNVEKIANRFSNMGIVAMTALSNIANKAVDTGMALSKSLTVQPMIDGLSEYELKLGSIQTILVNTQKYGTTLDDVSKALTDLNSYADKTIYNFGQMTQNIGRFTTAGVDLDTSVTSIKGIANLAAASGANANQAASAMYNLSQAISTGSLKLMDWRSIENAGMGGTLFKETLFDTAKALGSLDEEMDKFANLDAMEASGLKFRNTLEKDWISTEVLTTALKSLTGDYDKAALKQMGYSDAVADKLYKQGQMALDAATQVKTLSQLWDTTAEALGSGWAQTFEIIFGDYEQAKELFTKWSKTISSLVDSSADARNKMFEGWADMGGREDFINSIENVAKSLSSVLKPIGEAFTTVFGKLDSKKLKDFTQHLEDFTKKMIPTQATTKKLNKVFQVFFKLIKIGVKVVKNLFTALGPLREVLSKLFSKITDGIVWVSELILKFGDWIDKSKILEKASEKISNALSIVIDFIKDLSKTIADKLSPYIDQAKEKFSEFAGSFKESFPKNVSSFFENTSQGFKNLLENIKGLDFSWFNKGLEKISETTKTVWGSIKEYFQNIWDNIKQISEGMEGFGDKLKGFFGSVKDVLKDVWDWMKKIGGGIKEFLGFGGSKDDYNFFSALKDTAKAGGAAGVLLAISKMIGKIGDAFDKVSGLFSDASGVLDQVKDSLKAYEKEVNASVILKIAAAIAIMALSIRMLSDVDVTQLLAVTAALGTMMAGLGTLVMFSGSLKQIKSFKNVVLPLLGLSAAILILASALKKLSDVPVENIITAGTALTVLIGVLSLLGSKMGKMGDLSSSFKTIIQLSIGIWVLAQAMKTLGKIPFDNMANGLVAITGGMTIFVVALNKLPKDKNIVKSATAVVVLSAAMTLMAHSIKKLGDMNLAETAKGLATIAGGLTIMCLALKAIDNSNTANSAKGLKSVAFAMILMIIPIKQLGAMDWGSLAKGLIGVGGALAILAIGLSNMSSTKEDAKALILAAAAMLVLTPALKLLGNTPWQVVVMGLTYLAGVFTTFAVAAKLLDPVVPSMMNLGKAMLTLTGSVALISAAIWLFATSLGMFAVSGTAGFAALAGGITILLAVLPLAATALAAAITLFIVTILGSAGQIGAAAIQAFMQILNQITIALPQIFTFLSTIIDQTLKFLVDEAPKFIEAGFQLLMALLNGIDEHIVEITNTVINIITKFIDTIAANIGRIIDSGINLMLEFINGLADGIHNHQQEFWDAISNLVTAAMELIIGVFTEFIPKIWEKGKEMMRKVWSGITEIWDTKIKPFFKNLWQKIKDAVGNIWEKVKSIGSDIVNGIKSGISGAWEKMTGWFSDKVDGLIGTVKGWFGIHSPSKVFAAIARFIPLGMQVGIESTSKAPIEALNGVSNTMIGTAKEAFKHVGDELDGNIDIEPVITPIMDLSNVKEGERYLDQMDLGKNIDLSYTNSAAENIAALQHKFDSARFRYSNDQNKSSNKENSININIESMQVREEADIDRIANELSIRIDRRSRAII